MNSDERKKLRKLCKQATPGPWAWEQYGDKENCYHIGVAYDIQNNPVSGRVESERYDPAADIFVEDVLWRESFGSIEGATVNYSDAEFIAASRTAIPALLDYVDELEKLVDKEKKAHEATKGNAYKRKLENERKKDG